MPSKETIAKRKLIHSTQVSDGKLEWLCIRCNEVYPTEDFLTKRKGYRMKCKTCSSKEAAANAKYRLQHIEKVAARSKYYEEKRKLKRDEIIQKHKDMVKQDCTVTICTKCKQEKPIASFRNHCRKVTRHCYECRQYQNIIESRRMPDVRVRNVRTKQLHINHYSCRKYCAYRQTDISKGYYTTSEEFELMLPRNYAYNLMKLPCTYCGFYEDSKIGLDRVNPTKPHSYDNVVSCCETCNVSKNMMTIGGYCEHIKRMATTTKYWRSPSGVMECPF